MKVVLCMAGADFSIADVSRGYLSAFRAMPDVEVVEYHLSKRMVYHRHALAGQPASEHLDYRALSKLATENIICEALYHEADAVLIVSGLGFHAAGLHLLRKAGIPTSVLFTESPYEDKDQIEWALTYPGMHIATTEITSANHYGWTHIPHAHDPAIHYPRVTDLEPCDVLMIGTGWPARQRLLERVDWTGIKLRLLGQWNGITDESPLAPYYEAKLVDNEDVPNFYASAKICLNFHRETEFPAESLGPRAYEIAACEAFQLSDQRAAGAALFGESVPTFRTARQLEDLIRYYLAHDAERLACAAESRRRVQYETFTARAAVWLDAVRAYLPRSAAA